MKKVKIQTYSAENYGGMKALSARENKFTAAWIQKQQSEIIGVIIFLWERKRQDSFFCVT